MKRALLTVALFVLVTPLSHALQETSTVSSTSSSPSTENDDDFGTAAANVFKVDDNTHYDSNLKMREARKIGLALDGGGTMGLVGFNMEINFEDEDGAIAGFGGGAGYSSFAMAWKHVFEGDTLAPYTTLGVSRWYNSGGAPSDYKNSPILDRVLSDGQKNSGRFGADFMTGSLGIQYAQLNGSFAGTTLFAEVVLLMDVDRLALVPTGGVGAGFYF